MSPKTKKILNIVVDVIVAIILALALVLAICTITSRAKGYTDYTEIFGKAYLAVQSDSMAKDYETGEVGDDNFSKGDLIVIKTLDENEAKSLKIGDIITFKYGMDFENGKYILNTHRIIDIKGEEGNATGYITRGDNNPKVSKEEISVSDVVGVYQGHAGGIGNVMLFMSSSAGFFTCIVLPTLLVVVYCAVNLVLVIRSEKKAQAAEAEKSKEDSLAEERRKLREEILAEMQANGEIKPDGETKTDADGK